MERQLTKSEAREYINACSQNIFGTEYQFLGTDKIITLKVNLLAQKLRDVISKSDYQFLLKILQN